MKTLNIAVTSLLLVAGEAFAASTVSDVVARQRWPWNGKVDLVYTVKNLLPDTAYWLEIAVKASGKESSVRVEIPSENGTKSLVVGLDAMLPAETQDVAAQLNVKLMGVE